MLTNHFKVAVRNVLKQKVYTFLNSTCPNFCLKLNFIELQKSIGSTPIASDLKLCCRNTFF